MSESVFCPLCKNLRLSPYHRCPPRWLVKHEDDDSIFEDLITHGFYASDAVEAAEKYAHRWFSDGDTPNGDTTFLVCSYPAMDEITKVTISVSLVVECAGRAVETLTYQAFEETDHENTRHCES